ncbi:hypothetical protein CC78DRAFT_260839 [Lojkania enalia]|uniref:Zn(2)-C6 fungal-type domain-containing protein n=1 Tax=Lojkania enalia TaxID=147567 RepID=A0A9P4K8R7_9PLEO|nr:hypothetical protein CC78DRAFT_260839 [Didymosphaeria enalia]
MAESKVYKKRPHRKVKSGCATCKRRKIKCDEEKPQCSNCVRYSAECVYPTPPLDTSPLTPTPPSLNQTPEGIAEEPPVAQYPKGINDLPIRDLALMHQWSVSTSLGFGDDFQGLSDPWRIDVPILAQSNHFLMRGILAVTALHISKLTTDPTMKLKYAQLAAWHQDLALPEYRAAIVNVTEENATAILAFASLTTVYSFTTTPQRGGHFTRGVPEWVYLHRGVGRIPQHWYPWIENGPLRHQLCRRRLQPVDPTANPDDYHLVCLRGMLCSLPPEEQSDGIYYEQALQALRQAFAHAYLPESRIGPKYALLIWIEQINSAFLELLYSQKPRALVLFAHCCILLKRAALVWFLDGTAELILTEIKGRLTEDFYQWIGWPLEICGMV